MTRPCHFWENRISSCHEAFVVGVVVKFPLEVLFLRDDDIPQSVATGVADIGIVGENEFVEKNENAEIIKRLGFRSAVCRSLCRRILSIRG